ncbi:MAG TPA: amidohydrolase family protein [Solirubrobacter sp.]|nr:amidohydrolase family protein [Solirubrobacter sp.]
MILDAHTHLFDRFEYLEGMTAEQMIATMDGAGVETAVLFTVKGLLGGLNAGDYRATNEEIAETAARFPGRFIPFASVNPRDGDAALEEMERAVKDLGCRGFKLHPWWTSFPANSPAALDVARQGDRLEVPFIIHSGTPPTSTPLQIAEMARVAPRATLILAHMGLSDLWKEALHAAARYPNILLETCGTPSLAIQIAVDRLGADRVVYGSDMPFGGHSNVRFQIQKIRDLGLPEASEQLVLSGNMRRLLGIESNTQ